MITFFTTAKPFRGHTGIIQRNALTSWTLLHPGVEVILFGDEEGAAEAARELGIRHEPHVERSEGGTKRLDYLFTRARKLARHEVLCYVNCDVILMDDFCSALNVVRESCWQFLMVGRRWDAEIREAIDFSAPNWRGTAIECAMAARNRRPANWIDYFAFSRELYDRELPPFVIGRIYWDNWLLWFASHLGITVVDASDSVLAIHQNHDDSYHPNGKHGIWRDEESQKNFQLAGGYGHLRAIDSARWRLVRGALAVNPWRGLARWRWTAALLAEKSATIALAWLESHVWRPVVNLTRPARQRAGLRQENMRSVLIRNRSRNTWSDE
jgi:hypothetical protein